MYRKTTELSILDEIVFSHSISYARSIRMNKVETQTHVVSNRRLEALHYVAIVV